MPPGGATKARARRRQLPIAGSILPPSSPLKKSLDSVGILGSTRVPLLRGRYGVGQTYPQAARVVVGYLRPAPGSRPPLLPEAQPTPGASGLRPLRRRAVPALLRRRRRTPRHPAGRLLPHALRRLL